MDRSHAQANPSGWAWPGCNRRWKEPAWHRRARAKRAEARLAAHLAAHCMSLATHHGSALPGLLQRAFVLPDRADAVPSCSLQQALRRWGSPEVDDEAAEAAAKATEEELRCKLSEAATAAEQAAAASAALEEAQGSLKEAMRLAGYEAATTVAVEAERQGIGLEEARRIWEQARRDAQQGVRAGAGGAAVVAAREELRKARLVERLLAQAAEEAKEKVISISRGGSAEEQGRRTDA